MKLFATMILSLFAGGAGGLFAATVSVVGGVTAIGNASGVTGDVRGQNFNSGANFTFVPPDLMAADGLTILTDSALGPVSGTSSGPRYLDHPINNFLFPSPGGGGSHSGNALLFGAVLEIDPLVEVTQFGLTMSRNATQFITAYDRTGVLIGQLEYDPSGADSNFVGIDTGSTPIGWLAVGNDDLAGGTDFSNAGFATVTDDWMWNYSAVPEPEEWALMILGGGGLLFWWWRRRRLVPVPA